MIVDEDSQAPVDAQIPSERNILLQAFIAGRVIAIRGRCFRRRGLSVKVSGLELFGCCYVVGLMTKKAFRPRMEEFTGCPGAVSGYLSFPSDS